MKRLIEIKSTNRHKQNLAVLLATLIFLMATACNLSPTSAQVVSSNLVLFENNEVKAVLVVRNQGNLTDTEYEYITDAASLIRKHFKDATGHELPQISAFDFRRSPKTGSIAGKIKINLGWNGLNPHPALEQTLIDLNAEADFDGNHGYVFAPYADNVVIQSPTPLGVRYGAAAFLRKYLDVEWLMPGPYGADTPSWDKIAIPQVLVSSAPAFNVRYAYNIQPPPSIGC